MNASDPLFSTRLWEMPELTAINRVPMRATLYPQSVAREKPTEREKSPWFRELNGSWLFKMAARPEDMRCADVMVDTPRREWDTLEVPGNWTLQGYGQPHYTNYIMPFNDEPPFVPEANPTGTYVREFDVPKEWSGRRVVIHFGGAESVLCVYVNGRYVGCGKDTRLPSEFDLTDVVNIGEKNMVAAVVIKWSDASFIEDQDQWWMGGLHREVYLYSTPHTYIADVFARGGLDARHRDGKLKLTVKVQFARQPEAGWEVEASLLDPKGKSAWKKPLRKAVPIGPYRASSSRLEAGFDETISNVMPWSSESPQLYSVVLTLRNPQGRKVDCTSLKTGFRSIEIKGRNLLINGKRVLINGMNRHDHHETKGKALDRATLRLDALEMKRHNVNAVRCSHYPNDPYWLDVCDELGLYVVDEANIESHDYFHQIAHDRRYTAAFLDRGLRMVERDKNHPSVIIWSLGNESGYGENHDAMAGWMRAYDPGRPLQCEASIINVAEGRLTIDAHDFSHGTKVSDIIAPMYTPIAMIKKWALDKTSPERSRPFILCEYSISTGNSNGSLADYFDAFETLPGVQGGFVWQWIDHSLKQKTADGTEYLAYGGDFGDTPNDTNFVCTGLVWPDRTPHPAMAEFQHLAQPIKLLSFDRKTGVLQIRNKQHFKTLEWIRADWRLEINGVVKAKGQLPLLKTAPQENAKIKLNLPSLDVSKADEVFLNLRFSAAKATPWCEAGQIIGWDQTAVKFPTAAPKRTGKTACPEALELKKTADGYLIANSSFSLQASASHGRIENFCWAGQEIITTGPALQLWRAATDNDGVKTWDGQEGKPMGRWLAAGLDKLKIAPRSLKTGQNKDGSITLTFENIGRCAASQKAARHRQTYLISGDGNIRVENDFTIHSSLPDLPRLGVTMALPPGFEKLKWFGRGPLENYSDRKRSSLVGLYTSTVTGQYVAYTLPQEHGNHTDTRWLSLANARVGLRIEAVGPLEFSTSHFTAHDIFAAFHTYDLKPRAEVILNLDYGQRGLGTGSCGPDTLDEYKIMPGHYRWVYLLQPYSV